MYQKKDYLLLDRGRWWVTETTENEAVDKGLLCSAVIQWESEQDVELHHGFHLDVPVGRLWDGVWYIWKPQSGAQQRGPGHRYTVLRNESVRPRKPALADLSRKKKKKEFIEKMLGSSQNL